MFLRGLRCFFPTLFFYVTPQLQISVNFGFGAYYAFGFLSGQDLTGYQYSLLSAHFLLYPKVLIRADLYSRLAESPLEGGSKYGLD